MAVHQRTIVLLQGSSALMALAFLACGLGAARADVPMLSRHASFDGELTMRTWTGTAAAVVGSAQSSDLTAGNEVDAEALVHADVARTAREALFVDGFQPPAR